MNLKNTLLLGSLAFLLTSCAEGANKTNQNDDSKKKTTTVESSNGEVINMIAEDDKDMNKAIDDARNTFDDFVKVFKESKDKPQYHDFFVKIGFESAEYGKEHMWVGDLRIEDGVLKGVLYNIPMDETIQYKEGDVVVIEKENVSDWTYIESTSNNKEIAHGGYTYKAMRKNMTAEEKADFDNTTGLYFED